MLTFSQLLSVSKQTKYKGKKTVLAQMGYFACCFPHIEQFNLESAQVSKGMTGCYNYKLLWKYYYQCCCYLCLVLLLMLLTLLVQAFNVTVLMQITSGLTVERTT